ncbi:hypothetical protein HYFRA_00003396 [Hymenoscyphus fraxineus]|uniref:Uncharacterized protein n=1 Tax=Hymenoscyphus fraxineus TaxID=746836 RepID=A0A9N9PRK6_9HELO|nr:hypothetical protein HYFRA_00003396 [Hymenoscyphus fraxineus]
MTWAWLKLHQTLLCRSPVIATKWMLQKYSHVQVVSEAHAGSKEILIYGLALLILAAFEVNAAPATNLQPVPE